MPVQEAYLRQYVAYSIVERTLVKKIDDGWMLQVQLGGELHALQKQRGGNRTFKSLDKLAALIEELGLGAFEVQLAD
ncbi:hypothetical protein [Pseudomonas peli]|uniref:hypothetical protein n=1 Tax=Pseudomonas peli TaxID=592361 RepID=UPI003D323FB4